MRRLPRRVLHVMNGAAGGAALSTIGLIQAMRAFGIAPSAVCLDAGSDDERKRLLDACDGRVRFGPLFVWNKKIRARAWKRPLLELRQLLRTGAGCWSSLMVSTAAQRFGAELIHSNTILTIEGGLVAAHLGLPHVWHLRELVGAGAPFQMFLEGPALGRFLADHSSIMVANSEVTAGRLSPLLPEGLLEVVENGIDVDAFRRKVVPPPPVVVGMVANLTSRTKKHALFIDAIAALPRHLPVEARIYGHGAPDAAGRTEDAYVADLVERSRRSGARIVFAGHVSTPEAAMEQLDVLVHPADNESFGRVVIEAWAAGVAVVGVSGGGVGAIVTDEVDGLLAPPDDVAALSAQLRRVVEQAGLRQRLGEAGRATVERRFSLRRAAERMSKVYVRAMERALPHASSREMAA